MYYRTPLIRLIVTFCSYGGLQLKTVDSLGGVVNLLWNLFIASIIIYALFVLHFETPFVTRACYGENNGGNSTSSNHISPLFSLFMHSTFSVIRPVCFTIGIVYYLVAGRRLLALLDSPLFSAVYHSTRQACIIMGTMFFAGNFIFITFWLFNQHSILDAHAAAIAASQIKWSEGVLFLFSQYMVNMYQFSVCLVLHYYQHATLLIVRQIDRRIKAVIEESTSSKQYKLEDHCLRQMMALGKVNAQISRLVSVPLLTYIVMNGAQATMSVCFTLLCTPSFSMLANSLSVWVYLLYLAVLNERIKRLVTGVFSVMRRRYQPVEEMMHSKQLWAARRMANRRQWWYIGVDDKKGSSDDNDGRGRRQRRSLRLQHADLYQSYFTIKMFHFTWLGLPFIFQMILFVANYVILMTQTQ